MRWAEHVARIGQRCIENFDGKAEGRDHLEDLRVDGEMILKRILKKANGRAWTILAGTVEGLTSGSYEHSNEQSRSIKRGKRLQQLAN
jgi:hypothetical protein